ncbi:MAG: NAD(P)H-dependent oxidoreductase subunit E [Acidimicrobiales bacterium]|nr:NAD(P)H-dependent oxidoreductase subunit E [Acidimicrobiales bacterium]
MARFSANNLVTAQAIIARYPKSRSALVPLCHLAQEQDGYLTDDAMEHIAELIGCTPAQVYGTASFYEMFKLHPCGKYVVGVCTNISCMLTGAYELLEHCEKTLGVSVGGTTADGMFTLEEVECSAACTVAPAVQVNYRYQEQVTPESFDAMVADIRAGKRDDIPLHGTLGKVRQTPTDRWAESGKEPA